MLDFVAETATEAGLDDYRVIVNVGAGAGQTVFHLHWHILGGRLSGLADEPDRAHGGRAQGGDEGARRRPARRAAPDPRRAARRREGAAAAAERRRGAAGAPARAQAPRGGGRGVRGGGREEQADAEEHELEVLEEFMPEPLSEDELERIVDDAIAEVGATSMRDLGRVMADVMPQVAGRADGSVVSQIVREKLA